MAITVDGPITINGPITIEHDPSQVPAEFITTPISSSTQVAGKRWVNSTINTFYNDSTTTSGNLVSADTGADCVSGIVLNSATDFVMLQYANDSQSDGEHLYISKYITYTGDKVRSTTNRMVNYIDSSAATARQLLAPSRGVTDNYFYMVYKSKINSGIRFLQMSATTYLPTGSSKRIWSTVVNLDNPMIVSAGDYLYIASKYCVMKFDTDKNLFWAILWNNSYSLFDPFLSANEYGQTYLSRQYNDTSIGKRPTEILQLGENGQKLRMFRFTPRDTFSNASIAGHCSDAAGNLYVLATAIQTTGSAKTITHVYKIGVNDSKIKWVKQHYNGKNVSYGTFNNTNFTDQIQYTQSSFVHMGGVKDNLLYYGYTLGKSNGTASAGGMEESVVVIVCVNTDTGATVWENRVIPYRTTITNWTKMRLELQGMQIDAVNDKLFVTTKWCEGSTSTDTGTPITTQWCLNLGGAASAGMTQWVVDSTQSGWCVVNNMTSVKSTSYNGDDVVAPADWGDYNNNGLEFERISKLGTGIDTVDRTNNIFVDSTTEIGTFAYWYWPTQYEFIDTLP